MVCPICNNEVKSPESKFCTHCGGVMAALEVIKCPKCGFAAQQGGKFCKKCGFSFETASNIKPTALKDDTQETHAANYQPSIRDNSTKRSERDQTSKLLSTQKAILLTMIIIIVAALGGTGYAYLQGYILDQKSPEVTIASPAGGRTITLNTSGETIRNIIEIKAKDNGKLKKVELLVNTVPVQSYDNFDSMIFNWETGKEGEYIFYAVAQDYCGNTGKSSPIVIEVKNFLTSQTGTGISANFPGQTAGSIPGRWTWTSQRPVNDQDLRGLSAWELNIMRNEIYARYGWNFELQELRNYFYSQPWYSPKQIIRDIKTTNDEATKMMTQLEKENAAKILEYQKAHGLL